MRRNDFREQTEDILSEYGAQYTVNGDTITWWFETDKKQETKIPGHVGDYRGLKNAAAKLKKEIEAVKPIHLILQEQSQAGKDKLTAYLDKCLHDIRVDFESKLSAVRADLNASSDIALEAALKVDGFAKALQGMLQPTVASVPTPIEQPKIAVAQALPTKPQAPQPQQEENGLAKLAQLKAKQWTEVLAEIDAEFELGGIDSRILYFLYKCGPQTPHDLKVAGVWRSTDSVTRYLQDMEAEKLVRYLVAEKRWGITNEGIAWLDGEDEELETQHPSTAFEKIEEGLTEALAFARGEPNHAKVVNVPAAPAQKPALTIVPKEPRVLKPIASLQDAKVKLSFVEKSMLALLKGDMTITELQKAIGHTSNPQSLIQMLWKCENDKGYIKYHYYEGKMYRITEAGRAYITRTYPSLALAAS